MVLFFENERAILQTIQKENRSTGFELKGCNIGKCSANHKLKREVKPDLAYEI